MSNTETACSELETKLEALKNSPTLSVSEALTCVDDIIELVESDLLALESERKFEQAAALYEMITQAFETAARKVPEIELHPRVEAPLQGHFVDGDCPLRLTAELFVHGRMKMIGRIQVSAVVSGELDPLHGPPFTIRQILGLEAREKSGHLLRRILVIEIGDLRFHPGRV